MNELDTFGEFFVKNSRDSMIEYFEGLLNKRWKSPEAIELQDKLEGFSNEQKIVLKELVDSVVTTGMHDLLFAFQEATDLEKGISINVKGINPAEASDGLHGEIFGEDGWIAEFSSHKQSKPT